MNDQIVSDFVSRTTLLISAWWSDLVKLKNRFPESVFVGNVKFSLGNGAIILFCEVIWFREICLKELFPNFFQLSILKEAIVAGIWSWEGNVWQWVISALVLI